MMTTTGSTSEVTVATTTVPSHPESITPPLQWDNHHHIPVHNAYNTNEALLDDWWNLDSHSQQFADHVPWTMPTTTSITTTTTANYHNHSDDPDKQPRFLPMKASLRIQDVLERLDLDDNTSRHDRKHELRPINMPYGVGNSKDNPFHETDTALESTRKSDTEDYYFWDIKSPCKWYQQTQHNCNKRRRQASPPELGEMYSSVRNNNNVVILDFNYDTTTTTTNPIEWTTFPCYDTLGNHPTNPIERNINHDEWTRDEIVLSYPFQSTALHSTRSSFMISSCDETSRESFMTPAPTVRKKLPLKRCRCTATKSMPKDNQWNVLSLSSCTVDVQSSTAHVNDSISPIATAPDNDKNSDRPTFSTTGDRTCQDHESDDDDDDNMQNSWQQSSTAVNPSSIDNNTTLGQLLQQKETIQENDLLLRNNRQVLHRLAYQQIMGIHLTDGPRPKQNT
jgi:hypothetical protein